MSQVSTSEFRSGMKILVDNTPFIIVANEFVKPGKGQAFNRVKLKHLMTGRTIERTFKSGDKVDEADVVESQMRMLYKEADGVVFMDDKTYDQVTVPLENIGDVDQWLKEDILYEIVFYNGQAVSVGPPTFMELLITQTDPAVRGDTASGRVMKPAELETGAKVQIPIFVGEGEIVKIDTRTGEYVSRATE